MSWDECPQALQEGFSILPILERDKSLTVGCVRYSVDEREHSERESTSFSEKMEGTCVSKNFDETVRLQSRKEKSGSKR